MNIHNIYTYLIRLARKALRLDDHRTLSPALNDLSKINPNISSYGYTRGISTQTNLFVYSNIDSYNNALYHINAIFKNDDIKVPTILASPDSINVISLRDWLVDNQGHCLSDNTLPTKFLNNVSFFITTYEEHKTNEINLNHHQTRKLYLLRRIYIDLIQIIQMLRQPD